MPALLGSVVTNKGSIEASLRSCDITESLCEMVVKILGNPGATGSSPCFLGSKCQNTTPTRRFPYKFLGYFWFQPDTTCMSWVQNQLIFW